MATFNGTASLAGNSTFASATIQRAAVQPFLAGVSHMAVGTIQRFNAIVAPFVGLGLLDDFRVSNTWDYDPQSPRQRVMQLRHPRLSTEGVFGED